MNKQKLFKNYPKKGTEKRIYYVKHPVFKDGIWWPANVLLPMGYDIPANAARHKTEVKCQLACDLHNRFHYWTKEEANAIITESMNNSK